ncbi:MAG: hypothetical protein ACRD0J_07765 [Acidimicrobiales bacterium]
MTATRWWLGWIAIGGLGLAACGSTTTISTGGTTPGPTTTLHPTSAKLAKALKAWAGFPVDATPRPLVLVGSRVAGTINGFPNGAAKQAFIQGAFNAPAKLPAGPSTTDGYPVITATKALGMLESTDAKGPPVPTRLTITTVQLGTGTFVTDRGDRRLPAWLFSLQGVQGRAAVLAVAANRIFSPPTAGPSPPPGLDSAQLSHDGRTLTVGFTGAAPGTGPCTANYTLEVGTSRAAVVIGVHKIHHSGGNSTSGVFCSAVGYSRHATTVLSKPLGPRVLVDAATNTAVEVTRR